MNIADLTDLARVRAFVETGAARPIRLHAGLSLGEVAKAVGVSPATVHRWENRQRVPRGEPAVRYGELLDALATRRRP